MGFHAAITLLRTLHDSTEDQWQQSTSLIKAVGKEISEINIFPISEEEEIPLKLQKASRISSPKNQRLAFTELKSIPPMNFDMLSKPLNGDVSKTRGGDDDPYRDLNTLLDPLQVPKTVELQLLLKHLKKTAEMVPIWVQEGHSLHSLPMVMRGARTWRNKAKSPLPKAPLEASDEFTLLSGIFIPSSIASFR